MSITFLKSKTDKAGASTTTVDFVKKIKTGEWKKLILELRSSSNPKRRTILKGKLPAVTLCGIVDNVNNKRQLIQPSGYIGIDIDYKGKDLTTELDRVKKDRHTVAAWHSSGGKGFWIIFKINPKFHEESFRGIVEYLAEKYSLTVDTACGDKPRLCFVSYDPEVKFNHSAKIFLQYPKVKKENQKKQSSIPLPVNRLEELKHITLYVVKSKKDITKKYEEWFNTAVLYAEAGENGRALFHSVSKFHGTYDKGETDQQYNKCLKFISNDRARQKLSIKTLYHYLSKAKIECPPFKPQLTDNPSLLVDGSMMTHIDGYLYRWRLWEFYVSGKGFKCRGLNPDGVGEFLNKNGYRVWGNSDKLEFYHITNNIIHRVSRQIVGERVVMEGVNLPKDIKFCFDDENNFVTRDAILSETQRTAKKIVESIYPKTFDPLNPDLFLRDTDKETFLKFSNTVVRVTNKKIQLVPYTQIKKLIWADTIKPYEFRLDSHQSVLEKVLDKAIGAEHREAYMSAVGYMINSFVPPSGSKILFCCDLNLISGINNGGNGKDFIAQILNQVRKVTVIKAKHLSPSNRFQFQKVSKDSELIWLEDLNKNVTMEALYNLTDSISVERKNEQSYDIQLKLGASLQHSIDMEGTSDKRRQIFLLFTNYFGQLPNGIAQEYGELLGPYFDLTERLYVNNFLARCCLLYHKRGVVQMPFDSLLELRREELGEEVYSQLRIGVKYTKESAIDAIGGRGALNGISEREFIRGWRKWASASGYTLERYDSNGKHYYTCSPTVVLKLSKRAKES